MRTAERLHSLSPSELIVSRIASHEGVDPLDLDVPLYEAIDPDAVDALFGCGGTGPWSSSTTGSTSPSSSAPRSR